MKRKIGIKYNFAIFNEFFINLACYLRELGHEVYLFDAPAHVRWVWQHYNAGRIGDGAKIAEMEIMLLWNGYHDADITNKLNQKKTKLFYFENGYFPKTLQLGRHGVNAQSDVAKLSSENLLNFNYPHENIPTIYFSPIKISRLVTTFAYMLTHALHLGQGLHALYKQLRKLYLRFRKKVSDTDIDISSHGKYILFPLQVNDDTQITINSPFTDMSEAVDKVISVARKLNLKLILKEHPQEHALMSYKKFCKMENVFCCANCDLRELIEKASFIVVVNSSVGLQALSYGKKLVLLGDACYGMLPGVFRSECADSECIQDAFERVMQDTNTMQDVSRYIDHFKNDIFIKGDWKNPDAELLHNISQRILASD